MELNDLQTVLSLFDRNVSKLQANLSAYNREIESVRQSLIEKWPNISCADGRLISVHDCLLSSVNAVNEYVIKLNLHINLNRNRGIPCIDANENTRTYERKSLQQHNNNIINHTNLDGIEVGEVDTQSATSKELKQCTIQKIFQSEKNLISPSQLARPVLPIPKRQSELLPPRGGKHMTSEEAYDQLSKNISAFVIGTVVEATMMHINKADNCIFVGKWGKESVPLIKLLAGQMPLLELQQLPDYGEIFAVFDDQGMIMPRVLINAPTESGGYDAYLVDYGEHIHLGGREAIFGVPKDVAAMPAEAIKCEIRNHEVGHMIQFLYQHVRLKILANNGIALQAEFLEQSNQQSEEEDAEQITKASIATVKLTPTDDDQLQPAMFNPNLLQSTMQLSKAQMAMLETIEKGTSNAVKAVLGFNPTDDKRICRHYDPKIGGCFKGSTCRMLHQNFASHGATKDKELTDALPEASFVSMAPRDLGSVVRIEVTYINSSTQIYVQFVEDATALVWSKNDVAESDRKLKRAPRPLDVVLALYSDGFYYRAQIIDDIDGMFKIFYVDYGNTEFVTINSLAHCNNARSLKPHRAVSCFIEGIKCNLMSSRGQTAECVEFLKSTLLNSQFDVLLVSQIPDGYVIRLLDHYAQIAKQMIKRGYVQPDMDN